MSLQRLIKLVIVWILHVAVKLVILVTHPIFRHIYEPDRHKFRVPPADSALLLKPAIELASMIRRKEVSKLHPKSIQEFIFDNYSFDE